MPTFKTLVLGEEDYNLLLSTFQLAERLGTAEDDPEGSRYIQISATLATKLLKMIAE
jgi:hypothetical protein